jgi:hypothetical protein
MMLNLLKDIADRSGGLAVEDAKRLCAAIPCTWYTVNFGYSHTSDSQFAKTLRDMFPAFSWRIILDRSGERTRWTLTVDDDDPREHYFDRLGGQCVHCGKSSREIARIDEVTGDDEFLSELEARMESNHAL